MPVARNSHFRWQEAHDVIVKEIAPEAVIGQDYDYLHRLEVEYNQPENYLGGQGGPWFLMNLNCWF